MTLTEFFSTKVLKMVWDLSFYDNKRVILLSGITQAFIQPKILPRRSAEIRKTPTITSFFLLEVYSLNYS